MTKPPGALGILTLSALLVGALSIASCGTETREREAPAHRQAAGAAGVASEQVDAKQVVVDQHGEPAGVHRHKRWSEKIGQGAQPAGDVAFRNLAALGYTTVLSVDGARPDVEGAKRHGLRYVHVPIGYDGVTEEQALRIVKAVETAPGPVFVHCHHGKHRGPTAVMVARMALEGLSPEQAIADMEASGTSSKYAGLFRDVSAYAPPSAEALAAFTADLPECVQPDGLIEMMVDVDLQFAHLGMVREASWGVPPDNPDVDPPHEARMLWENFREMARLDESRAHGEAFMKYLELGENGAKSLEAALRRGDALGSQRAYDQVEESCSTCHADFRNN